MTYTNPNQIGEVTEITGVAKIIRADGSEEPITLGAEIYIGDIVETDGAGAVNIGFVDDSSFAVSEDARISIDEFVFDPASESGDQDFSVVRGVFMYTSGLIGRENPDSVEIETPVGSIGIRGTIIGGKIIPDGESQVSVLEGAIVVRNDGGEQLLTNQFDTVKLTSRSVAPSEPKTLDVARVANDYGGVKSVSSSLFSSFEDQMNQEKSPNNVDDKKGDVENKAADEGQSEDKEASADEVVDETAEDVAVEEAKETLEADDAPDGPKDAIEHRADDIEELREHRTERRQQQEKRAELREEAEARQENNETDVTLAPQADALQVSSIAELYENQDGSATGIDIGQISLVSGASDVTYSLVNDAGGIFSINAATGVVSFVGADSGDYEAGDVYNIGVRAVNNDTGQVTHHPYEINVADVNEYSGITGNAMITSVLTENDESSSLASDVEIANLTFSEIDSATGNQTTFSTNDARFEVRNVGGNLKLVALTGASFDYETETSITVDVIQSDGANAYSNHPVTISISDINDETPTSINISNSNVAENNTAATIVGTLSTVDADTTGTYTYSIVSGDPGGIFTIVGNDIRINNAGELNFEEQSSYSLDVQVDDGNGNIHNETIVINVDDVNEDPTLRGAFEDRYSVTGNIDGVVPFGVDGAVITRLHVNDPDGDVFGIGDFSITGSVFGMAASNFFEIVDNGGNFALQLKSGYQIIESSGNFLMSSDGSTLESGTSVITSETFNIGVSLNDGGGNSVFENIIVSAGDVTHVTGTGEIDLSASQDIVFGDNTDNVMRLHDSDFKFMKGGAGHDLIKLDGSNSGSIDIFDMTSTVNNTAGNSADLKSIEEFRFVDQYDKLKLNIQDLKDLLKTSENGEVIFASGAVPDGTGAADGVNGVYFKDGGSNVQLTNHGFTNQGTVSDSGETFVKYTHAELGDVLIEQDINGASAGGII